MTICPTCRRSFAPAVFWQRFCSEPCRTKFHNDARERKRKAEARAVEAERVVLVGSKLRLSRSVLDELGR